MVAYGTKGMQWSWTIKIRCVRWWGFGLAQNQRWSLAMSWGVWPPQLSGAKHKKHRMAKEDTHGSPLVPAYKTFKPQMQCKSMGHGKRTQVWPTVGYTQTCTNHTQPPPGACKHCGIHSRQGGHPEDMLVHTRGKPQGWLRPPTPEKHAQHSRLGERRKGSREQKVRRSPASAPPSAREDWQAGWTGSGHPPRDLRCTHLASGAWQSSSIHITCFSTSEQQYWSLQLPQQKSGQTQGSTLRPWEIIHSSLWAGTHKNTVHPWPQGQPSALSSPHRPFPSKASRPEPAGPSPQHPLATAPTSLALSRGPQQRHPPGPPPSPISPFALQMGWWTFYMWVWLGHSSASSQGIKPRLHKAASRLQRTLKVTPSSTFKSTYHPSRSSSRPPSMGATQVQQSHPQKAVPPVAGD